MVIESVTFESYQQGRPPINHHVATVAKKIFVTPTPITPQDHFVSTSAPSFKNSQLKETAHFLTNGETVFTGDTKEFRKRLKKKNESSFEEVREIHPVQSSKRKFNDVNIHLTIPGVLFEIPGKIKDGLVWWFKKPATTILTAVAIQAGAAMRAVKEIHPAYASATTKADKFKLLLNKNIIIGSGIALSLLLLNLALKKKENK